MPSLDFRYRALEGEHALPGFEGLGPLRSTTEGCSSILQRKATLIGTLTGERALPGFEGPETLIAAEGSEELLGPETRVLLPPEGYCANLEDWSWLGVQLVDDKWAQQLLAEVCGLALVLETGTPPGGEP
jgi:hypothetical protein